MNRLAVFKRGLDPSVFEYKTTIPVFGSGAEAALHGIKDVRSPSPEAIRKIDGLTRLLNDKGIPNESR